MFELAEDVLCVLWRQRAANRTAQDMTAIPGACGYRAVNRDRLPLCKCWQPY